VIDAIPWWVTLALLIGFAAILSYVIWTPPKQRDPQMGMAIGCLMFVLAFNVVLLILFGIAMLYRVAWLEKGITSICLFVIGFWILSLIENLVKAWRSRR